MDDLEDLSRRQARAQNQLDPTRSRPAPWFVGDGRALMVGVVSIVAALLVARVVTTWWLAEEVWNWAAHRPPAQAIADAPAPRPLPPAPTSLPGSRIVTAAKGEEAAWITPDDYPASSIRHGEQGRSRIGWRIDPDGRVRRCGIIESSGYTRLDVAACRAITRRARYRPALDDAGRPVAMTKTRTVSWVLPED